MKGITANAVANRLSLVALLLTSLCHLTTAQTPQSPASVERDAILSSVQAFFDCMAAKDVACLARLVIPEGTFHSVRYLDGKPAVRTSTNQAFLTDLPGIKESLRERMWNPEVRVRGLIATVWAPYDFWRDGKLSHCGIDAFDMVKVQGTWRVAGGTYTVESNCEASPLGPVTK